MRAPAARPPRAAESPLLGAVRRHPLTAFLAWSATVGQAVAFVPVLARAGWGAVLPVAPFVVASTLVGLLLPAVALTWLVDGPEGLHRLRFAALQGRVQARWYVLALVVVPLATVATAAALLGPPAAGAPVLAAAVAAGAAQLVLLLVTTTWAEEVAWTGFVQVRVQDRHGPLLAAVLTGPLFALQHVSLVGGGAVQVVLLLVVLAALAVPFRALLGWVANRTGSLLLVALVHAAGNAMGTGSGLVGTGALPQLYPGEAVGPMHLLASAALGLVVVAVTRGRLGGAARGPGPRSAGGPAATPPRQRVEGSAG